MINLRYSNDFDEDAISIAIQGMKQGHYADAFHVLTSVKSECAEIQYNLGLCYYYVKQYESAATCFEKALILIRQMKPSAILRSHNRTILRQLEIANKSYLNPIDANYLYHFSNTMKENATLACIDAYRHAKRMDKVKILLSSLSGEEFSLIKSEQEEENNNGII